MESFLLEHNNFTQKSRNHANMMSADEFQDLIVCCDQAMIEGVMSVMIAIWQLGLQTNDRVCKLHGENP